MANDVSIFGSAYSGFMSTNCNASYASYPYIDPISHYETWHDKGFNMFRLAMSWQHVQTELSGPLNETNIEAVDRLVERITRDGNVAILDIVSEMTTYWFLDIASGLL
jgi:endoglucanase